MLNPKDLRRAVRHEGGISRRLFLAYTSALAALPWLSERSCSAQARPRFSADPFSLGVASGDPDATSVVLWTRLAPRPLDPDGGMETNAVQVTWEIADDEEMKQNLRTGI